jgi:ATPase family associated with various cellular activities (AAA)/Winged helix domain, variant
MTGWVEANQRALVGELARVRAALEGQPPPAGEPEPADTAIAALATIFGLSAFERDVLLLCAGVELDSSIADLCAALHGDPARRFATFSLALAALDGAHWSALAPAAPLRRWQLVELADPGSVTASALRVDERILHHLTGVDYFDVRLDGLVETGAAVPLAPSQATVAASVADQIDAGDRPARAALCGADPAARRAVAAAAARRLGLVLLVLRADALPAEHESLARLCAREAALSDAVIVVECRDGDGDPLRAAAIERFVDRLDAAVLTSAREPLAGLDRPGPRFDVERPTHDEQQTLWIRALGPAAAAVDGGVDALVSHFNLEAGAIARIAALAAGVDDRNVMPAIWHECRVQARPRLDDLAARIEPTAGWDDLVLPVAQRGTLRQIAAEVRARTTVHHRWGFAARSSRGLGTAALFSGAAGTGKTMAAEVLAGELDLDLYRIDLSAVVSKYIGETEKNLRRVFDNAEGSGAILLFDEADALFGKRTEVRDSHDRYANIEVSYLLQRMEAYRGLAILTTNLESALDQAFMRRLRFVVRFPFPDAAQRREIWQRTFPAATPLGAVDLDALARLDVAGGNIRNIGINAAFLAADCGERVEMEHVLAAARSEYAKLERPLSELELEGRR